MHFVLLSDHIFSTEISNVNFKIILPFLSKILLFLFGFTLLSHRHRVGTGHSLLQFCCCLDKDASMFLQHWSCSIELWKRRNIKGCLCDSWVIEKDGDKPSLSAQQLESRFVFLLLYLGFMVSAFKNKLNRKPVLFAFRHMVRVSKSKLRIKGRLNSLGSYLQSILAIAVFHSSLNNYIILLISMDLLGSPSNII